MVNEELREEARLEDIRSFEEHADIAFYFGYGASGVCGWKRKNSKTIVDWHKARGLYHLSTRALIDTDAEKLDNLLAEINEDPAKMNNPAIVYNIDVLERAVSYTDHRYQEQDRGNDTIFLFRRKNLHLT